MCVVLVFDQMDDLETSHGEMVEEQHSIYLDRIQQLNESNKVISPGRFWRAFVMDVDPWRAGQLSRPFFG